jgi:hypothetical protein
VIPGGSSSLPGALGPLKPTTYGAWREGAVKPRRSSPVVGDGVLRMTSKYWNFTPLGIDVIMICFWAANFDAISVPPIAPPVCGVNTKLTCWIRAA